MANQTKGLLAIVSANVIFGLNIPVTKALIANWMTPAGYTLTRMFFGAIVFWTIGLVAKQGKVSPKDLIVVAIGGFFGFIATQFTFAYSVKFTTPVNYSLMMALTPVVVLILSALFLKEAIRQRKLFGLVLSISGAILIILQNKDGGSATNNRLGIFFALLCVLSYAIYLLITREISIKYAPVTVVKWMFLFSALMLLPFGFSDLSVQRIYSSQVTQSAILLLAFSLLFSTTLAFFLMPIALKRLSATTVSIYMNLQPIVASVVAIVVGQDVFSWDKPLAAFLVITGVYLVTQSRPKTVTENV